MSEKTKKSTQTSEKFNFSSPGPATMLLVESSWGPMQTFKLLPISLDCPYIECMYNPDGKVLAIIGKSMKQSYHFVEKVDDNGKPVVKKAGYTKEEPHKMQRVLMDTFSEYYIFDKDIITFLEIFAVNFKSFDYKKYTEMKKMDTPNILGTTPAEPVELISV